MNFIGNADVSQESAVFRAMSMRLQKGQGDSQARTGVRQGHQQSNQKQDKPPSPKPKSGILPQAQPQFVNVDVGSMGVYVLSAFVLGSTYILTRGSGNLSVKPSVPESISIGGITLDL
jgi:hypothetical protein